MSIRPIISLTKKQTLRRQLSNCHLIAGIYCNGLSTIHLQNLRASLPKSSKLIIARNSLISQTLKDTKFEPLTQCATGMNGWLFVNDDEDLISKVMKIYRDFVKKEGLGFNDFRGAVFEGRVHGPEEIVELEHMPTRTERSLPQYLYPFLNTTSNEKPFDYLRLQSLGVIGELVRSDSREVIAYLLESEIVPLCLCSMEFGGEVSKTVSTFIIHKILLNEVGFLYFFARPESPERPGRSYCVIQVLTRMVDSLPEEPSLRLLKLIIHCCLRLSENGRAVVALNYYLPHFLNYRTLERLRFEDRNVASLLQQLLCAVFGEIETASIFAKLEKTMAARMW